MSIPALHRPRRPPGRRLSDVLADLADDPARASISIADVRDAMGDRAFGALLILLAVPNALPVNPPGVSTVLGVPIMFLAVQMVLGFKAPWLPGSLKQRSMARDNFARAMNVTLPWLRRVERLLKPRLSMLAGRPAERVIGVVCLLLALVLAMPIPFGNMPPAVAICVLALAMLEKDGLAVLAGLAVATGALLIGGGVLLGLLKAVSLFLRHLLGA